MTINRKYLAGILVLLVAACGNPAADKPKAEVKEVPEAEEAAAEAPEQTAQAGKIALDASNTTLGFVGAKVTGSHEGKFETVTGTVSYSGADPTTAKVEVFVDTASVKSDSEKLDAHLKSPDFFDVAKFPKATFVSTAITAGQGEAAHTVTGTLELHGVKKQISFPAKLDISDGAAKVNAVFSINRKDFGIVYPGMPDDLIRDDVVIKIDIDAPLK